MRTAILMGAALLLIAAGCRSEYVTTETRGSVVEKVYCPKTGDLATGLSMSGKPVFVDTSTPERYIVFASWGGIAAQPIETNKDIWLQCEKGGTILIKVTRNTRGQLVGAAIAGLAP